MNYERVATRYPALMMAMDFAAWLPVFFLFFSRYLTIEQVLQLEAVYYFAVVLFELPSGYLSDRVGRRRILLVAAMATCAACLVFSLAPLSGSFAVFAIAQILLAAGIAFRSGADTALHYESLKAIGKENEYGEREARAHRAGLIASAFAVLLGGVVSIWHPLLAYCATGFAGLVAIALLMGFGREAAGSTSAAFVTQLGECFRFMSQRVLLWLGAVYVTFFVLMHIPYELYQPYLKLLAGHPLFAGLNVTLVSALLFAATIAVSAYVAGRSFDGARRVGLVPWMMFALVVQVLVIAGLAVALHPALALLVLLRNVPAALIQAPMNAAVAPRIPDSHRATYLSLLSLFGRLGFALVLLVLSTHAADAEHASWPVLQGMLIFVAVGGLVVVAALALLGRRVSISESE